MQIRGSMLLCTPFCFERGQYQHHKTENRTHYIVMSGPSLDALMDGISSTLNSDNGQKFQKRASSVRKVLSTNLMLHIKTWN